MGRFLSVFRITLATLLVVALARVAGADPLNQAAAEDLAMKFGEALIAADAAELASLASVPFFFGDRLFRRRDELEARFAALAVPALAEAAPAPAAAEERVSAGVLDSVPTGRTRSIMPKTRGLPPLPGAAPIPGMVPPVAIRDRAMTVAEFYARPGGADRLVHDLGLGEEDMVVRLLVSSGARAGQTLVIYVRDGVPPTVAGSLD